MAAIKWKPNANGYWTTAANWIGGVVPGAADNVTLTSNAAHTIYYNTTDTVAGLISTDDLLALQGGTLSVSGTLTLAGGLNETGGFLVLGGAADSIANATISDGDVLLGPSTVLTLTGATLGNANNSYGARIHGPGTLTTAGTTTIADYNSGTGEATFGAGLTWINAGTVNDAGVVQAFYTPGTAFTLINEAGAVYDFTSDDASIDNGTVYNNQGQSETAGSVFTNLGTLEKTGGAGGTSNIYSVLDNTGTINVANGTLALDGGGTLGGTIIGAGSLALDSGNFVLTTSFAPQNGLIIQGVTVSIPDSVTISCGFSLNSGEISLTSAGTLSVSGAFFSGGDITGPGTLNTSGTTTVQYTNDLNVGGGTDWINSGVVNIAGQDQLYLDDQNGGGTFTNLAGAELNLIGQNYIYNEYQPAGALMNAGTLASTGTGTSYVLVTVQDTGVVSVGAGDTLDFTGGGAFSGTILGTGTVAFGSGVDTLVVGTTVGISNLLISGGTLELSGGFSYAGAFSLSGGALELDSSDFSVSGAVLGSGDIAGPGTLSTSGTTTVQYTNGLNVGGGTDWINSGVVNVAGNDQLYLDDQNGGGTFTNLAGAELNLIGQNYIYNEYQPAGALMNAGTLASTGTGTSYVLVTVQDTGVVSVGAGDTLDFTGGGAFAGSIIGAGTVAFGGGINTLVAGTALGVSSLLVDGGTLELGSGYSYGGAVSLSGGTLELGGGFTATSGFFLSGGGFELSSNAFSVRGAVLGSGDIDGPGTLSTSGTTTVQYTNALYFGGGADWINSGVVNVAGNDELFLDDQTGGSTLTNLAGATLNLLGQDSIGDEYVPPGTVINAGTLASTGTGISYIGVYVQDSGVISIAAGNTLDFTDGGTFSGTILGTGTVSLSSGIEFGNLSIASTAVFAPGENLGLVGNATIASNFADDFYTALNGDTLILSGTDSFGPLAGQGYYGPAQFDGPGTIITAGTVSVADNGGYNEVVLSGGAVWSVSGKANDGGVVQLGSYDGVGVISVGTVGVFDLTSDDAQITNGVSYDIYGDQIPVIGTFINAGLLAKTGGTLTNTVSATLNNTGTLQTNAGTLAFAEGGTLGGKILTSSHIALTGGDFVVNALTQGGTLTDAATIDQTGAVTLGSGSVAGVLSVSGTYNIDNDSSILLGTTAATTIAIGTTGSFGKLGGTNTSTITAAITNNGFLFVDSGKLLLDGALYGSGTASIANGATLEVAGSTGTGVIITLGTSSVLKIDQLANFKDKIANFVVGDTLDFGGLTVTSATASSGGILTLKNGTSTVGTLSLVGNHVGDVFTVGTDGAGGSLLGIASNSSSWTGGTADWTVASDWSAGVPMSDTAATIAGTGAKTITISYGESDTVKSLALTDANATLYIGGALAIGTSFAQTTGNVQLVSGTINGGTINATGGDFAVQDQSTFNSVQYQGNLDLTANYAQLFLDGGSIAGKNGAGISTISVTGYDAGLFVEGSETLNNVAITIGNTNDYQSYLVDYDPNDTGALLTLGTAASVTQTTFFAYIGDYNAFDTDGVFNSGAITGAVAGGSLAIIGNLFENDGDISISNGDALVITTATFTNAGTLSISGSTLLLENSNFTNTGSFALTNSTLNDDGSFATGQLLSLISSGDTLDVSGTLNNTGATLPTGTGTTLGAVTLAAGADIIGGTITDAGGGIVFTGDTVVELTGPTLAGVTYDGVFTVSQTDETVFLGTGDTFNAQNGASPGTIELTGANARLEFASDASLNNVTILFGSSAGTATYNGYTYGNSLDLDDPNSQGLTLDLGPNALVEDDLANSNANFANPYGETTDFILNQGTIAALAAGATIHVSETLTNLGDVMATGGGKVDFSGAFGTSQIVANLAGGTLTGGTWSVGGGSTIELVSGSKITTDAADIVLSGTASNIQGLSGSSQVKLDSTLATIASTGTLALLAGRNFSSTLAVTDAGQLNLGGTTFTANSLTIASGGTLSGTGLATNTITDNGVIASAAGGTLKVAGVTGAGTLLAAAGGVLEVAGTAAATDTVLFTGAGGTLAIDAAASFTAGFANLGAGDTLDFTALAGLTATISGTTLTVQSGANTYRETINSLAVGTVLATAPDAGAGTKITFYQQAAASLHSPEPVAFGQVHVGASLAQALAIANTAPATGYSESLDGSFAGASSLVTASGSFSLLAAGSTSTALTVSLATGTAGVDTGTAIITLASDGAGVDGLGTTSLGTQTVNLSATVFAYATASAIAPVNLGQAHVGATLSQFLVLDNAAAPGAYSENLDASFSGTSLGLSAAGSISELAAGASNGSALSLGVGPGTAGVASGTATLALISDGAGIDTLGTTTLAPETVTAAGTFFNLATASAPATLNFGQHHAGFAYSQTIVIADTAAKGAYSENLDASFSGTSSSLTTSGTISELAAGSSNSTSMVVTLHAGAGGAVTGATTINLTSDGTGIDSLGTTALAADTLAVSGTLFNYATASITSKTLNFGIVHAGSTVDQYITLSNTAAKGSYSETLDASFSGTSSAFTTSGSLSKLAAGSASSKTLEVLLNTGTAGAISAASTLKLTSDGGGIDSLGTSALSSQNVTITGTVNNYATASLETITGGGTLTGSGTTLMLNLGSVAAGGTLAETMGVLNSAVGPADLLSGSFNTGTTTPFTDTGFNSFSSIAAGGADNTLGISLSDLTAGTYTETIVLNAAGSNASGYSGTLAPETLVVIGTVTSGAMVPRAGLADDAVSTSAEAKPKAMDFVAPRRAPGSTAVHAALTGAEAFRELPELKTVVTATGDANHHLARNAILIGLPDPAFMATMKSSVGAFHEHHPRGFDQTLTLPIVARTHLHM